MENNIPVVDFLDVEMRLDRRRAANNRSYMKNRTHHRETKKKYASRPENRIKHDELTRKWRANNSEHVKQYYQQYYVQNKEKIIDKYLQRTYKITLKEYNYLLSAQKGVCALCQETCLSGKRLAVDHDHRCCPTGKKSCGKCVRALLCVNCNNILGFVKDSTELLMRCVRYLEELTPEVQEELFYERAANIKEGSQCGTK